MRCETNSGTARATALGTAWVRVAIGGTLGFLAIAGQALAQTPSIEYIEPSAGFAKTRVTGISDNGVVVGWSLDLNDTTNGPVFRYSPGGSRTEYAAGGLPAISGDGRVVAFTNDFTPNVPPRLYYDDGTFRDLPNLTLGGQERQGRVTHLNHDGSVAMLTARYDLPNQGRQTAYRWTLDGNATTLPPFPGGSSWNSTNSLSSDGSIVVGDWAPSSLSTDRPWIWTDGAASLTPVLDPAGVPIQIGGVGAISGDGRTLFYVSDAGPGLRFVSHDGVVEPWVFGGPLAGANIFPRYASFDGSVLVGSLSQSAGGGSWIWTPETGAMRANDYFILNGIDVSPTQNISNLIVSADGLHFAGNMGMPALPAPRGFVVTIPAPGIMSSLILAGIGAIVSRRRK